MTFDELRKEMESYRRDADEEAMTLKDSYLALDRLHELYRKFDSGEQRMADRVISEWALSADEKLRFDALALIDDFKIVRAVPALRALAERLGSSNAPGAPYELKKVERIIQGIAA